MKEYQCHHCKTYSSQGSWNKGTEKRYGKGIKRTWDEKSSEYFACPYCRLEVNGQDFFHTGREVDSEEADLLHIEYRCDHCKTYSVDDDWDAATKERFGEQITETGANMDHAYFVCPCCKQETHGLELHKTRREVKSRKGESDMGIIVEELQKVHFSIRLVGDSPKKLLGEKIKELKERKERGEIVDHPLLHAQSFNMLSVPEGIATDSYINNLLKADALKLNEVNCVILSLSHTRKAIKTEVASGRCSTNDKIHKGARKWVTYHVVYEEVAVRNLKGELQFDEKDVLITRMKEISAHITKGDAMAAAKEYATDNLTQTIVELERRLDGSDSRIAAVEPIMRDEITYEEVPDNHFKFFGTGYSNTESFRGSYFPH